MLLLLNIIFNVLANTARKGCLTACINKNPLQCYQINAYIPRKCVKTIKLNNKLCMINIVVRITKLMLFSVLGFMHQIIKLYQIPVNCSVI